MPFYVKDSISFGPMRLNISKSGVGASFGATGARVGVRPNGHAYFHGGRHGLYYRSELGSVRSSVIDPDNLPAEVRDPECIAVTRVGQIQREPKSAINDQASLVQALRRRTEIRRKNDCGVLYLLIAPLALAIGAVGWYLGFKIDILLGIVSLIWSLVILGPLIAIRKSDLRLELSQEVVAFGYAESDPAIRPFARFLTEVENAVQKRSIYGNSEGVPVPHLMKLSNESRDISSNISCVCLSSHNVDVVFLPDILCWRNGMDWYVADYREVSLGTSSFWVRDNGSLSVGATHVRKRYKHERVDGGPDRRYRDNPVVAKNVMLHMLGIARAGNDKESLIGMAFVDDAALVEFERVVRSYVQVVESQH